MVTAKGDCLGPYELLSHLGSGGMGEVWRARDSRIGRDVAVKILPAEFLPGDKLLRRFEQEARAAGGLNHPGLVTIYDFGTTSEGMPYIVMELLEGQTLRDVLGDAVPSPLPLRKAIDYAIQIASALAVAHGHGIIHRDLKPENLFITPDRRVKILDFGLAKLAPDVRDTDAQRRTSRHLTSAGFAVGTPGYMSPEQVRADPIDHRTDVFSLGAVLYEMITGRPAFERTSGVETMHAVLSDEPPPIQKPVSAALEETLRHCLEKDPRDRFQSAGDLAFHLQSLPEMQRTTTAHGQIALPRRRLSYRAGIIVLPLLLALAAGGFVWRGLHGGSSPAPSRLYRQLTAADGLEIFPTLAPDGKSFAYVSSQTGNRDIYVQRVDGRTAINVTADSPDDDSEPAFSPDGSKIAFRSERDGGGIFVMGVTGESPLRLTDFGHNPAWSPDGSRLVIATERIELLPHARSGISELWLVDALTGGRHPIVQAGKGGPDFGLDSDAVQPSWSPHGNRVAFWGRTTSGQREIWTIDPNAPEPKKTVVQVTSGSDMHWNPVWSPDGKYLYYGSDRDGTLNLWRVAMNEETGSPAGAAAESMALPTAAAGNFAFAGSGEMAYVAVVNIYRLVAVPFDPGAATIGPPRQLIGGSQEILTFAPSPDGKTIAYTTGGGTQEDIFVADADGTHVRQLTNDAAKDRSVEWSPDGKTLYFYSNRGEDGYRIWSIRADGSGLTCITDGADLKRIGARNLYVPVPSPDGHTLIVRSDRETSALVHLDRPAGQRLEPIPVLLVTPSWSPDGQSIIGRDRGVSPNDLRGVIMRYSLGTGRTEALSENGVSPYWTPDGKKIVYFERQDIRIIDLESRASKAIPFATIGGVPVDITGSSSRLARDASTLYLRQTIQQGDVWLVRFPNAKS